MRPGHLAIISIALAGFIATAGCDGYLRSRIKVFSQQGEPIPDALIRVPHEHHDLARFTDDKGCAEFGGVVAPFGRVPAVVEKKGYESKPLKLHLGESCLVVHLTSRDAKVASSVESRSPEDCPCASNAGYSPKMAARFSVKVHDGTPLEFVAVRRSTEPANQWSQVTDSNGCLGVTWIIPADEHTVPLVLERAGYQPVRVDTPAMEERCYSARLSRLGETSASSIVPITPEKCECAMFTGRTIWPERHSPAPK